MSIQSVRTSNTRPKPVSALVLLASCLALVLASCAQEVDIEPAAESTPYPTITAAPETPDPTPTTPEEQSNDPSETPTPPNPDSTQEPEPTATPEKDDFEPTPTSEPDPTPIELPSAAYLTDMTHMYQTWNNCSAASACMLLSYYDIHIDQEALRPILRPNDDAKHGKHERMIDYFQGHGLRAMLMHGGDVETLQAFLSSGVPIIVQQWLEIDNDPIGHYRVVRGYDDDRRIFRVNDSMFGGDVHYSYEEFNAMWQAFSYRYIPVFPPEKQGVVEQILGDQIDRTANRQQTAERIERELQQDSTNAELWFSLGTNMFDLGNDAAAIEAFERAESLGLPPKMLWYVYWPPAAYNNVGNHDRAISLAGQQISTANTFGDMRYERGRAFEAQGEIPQAIAEYQRALSDDPELTVAAEALQRLGVR